MLLIVVWTFLKQIVDKFNIFFLQFNPGKMALTFNMYSVHYTVSLLYCTTNTL